MRREENKCQSSHQSDKNRYLLDQSIGDLFRTYGEDYIRIYKPPFHHIKLIRSIRVCRTPALGGKRITCLACLHSKHIYLSCGNSQCPLCQNRKRELWQQNISDKLLDVPYVHTIFTIPHALNKLAKLNEREIYNTTMRAAWKTIKDLTAQTQNLGGLPGMVAVLHTFGSDMKHHIHCHALITFGGIGEDGKWHWPKHRKKLAPYRKICSTYRNTFLKLLDKDLRQKKIIPVPNMEQLIQEVKNKRWNVRNEYPTANTDILERYLARYINRIAISKSRLQFIAGQQQLNDSVIIEYKDYKKQIKGQPAPKTTKRLNPLVAINQFLLHTLPPYFQKSRYYGLHAAATYKRIKNKIPDNLKRNNNTVRIICAIIKHLAGIKPHSCEYCQGHKFVTSPLNADQQWIFRFITIPSYRGPPKRNRPNHIYL